MSKKWVQFQPRSQQLVEADQFNAEQQAARSSITTLDRTHMPPTGATTVTLVAGALHKCWVVPLLDPTGTRPGEQTAYNDTATNSDAWRCATYTSYGGGWEQLLGATLTGHKGGSIYVEWGGIAMCLGIAHITDSATANLTKQEKFLNLRLKIAGTVIAERMGIPGSIENFRIHGNIVLPAGDHDVVMEWRGTGAGHSDPILDSTTGNRISQYHIFNNHLFAIGRFR
jgi:hypothetical protein